MCPVALSRAHGRDPFGHQGPPIGSGPVIGMWHAALHECTSRKYRACRGLLTLQLGKLVSTQAKVGEFAVCTCVERVHVRRSPRVMSTRDVRCEWQEARMKQSES